MSIGRSVSLSKKSRKNKKNGGKNQIDKKVFKASNGRLYIYPRCTHSLTHSFISPHNALLSHLKLVPGLRACFFVSEGRG